MAGGCRPFLRTGARPSNARFVKLIKNTLSEGHVVSIYAMKPESGPQHSSLDVDFIKDLEFPLIERLTPSWQQASLSANAEFAQTPRANLTRQRIGEPCERRTKRAVCCNAVKKFYTLTGSCKRPPAARRVSRLDYIRQSEDNNDNTDRPRDRPSVPAM